MTNKIQDNIQIKLKNNFIIEKIDNKYALIDNDTNKYYIINNTAYYIFKITLNNYTDISTIIEKMHNIYNNIEYKQIKHDIIIFIKNNLRYFDLNYNC